jgi:tRNA A37 N6-isopentenylltransferase MiaA
MTCAQTRASPTCCGASASRRKLMKLDTRHYAKRQWTWWRAQPNTHWLSGFGFAGEVIAEVARIAAELFRSN